MLVGNWSDDYSLGQSPTSWTGSVQILLQYANTGVSVSFAQCWVFAGVFNTCEYPQGAEPLHTGRTTFTESLVGRSSCRYLLMLRPCVVLRAIGIPARVITNFNSAHDNTGNLKTDLIFNPDGTPDERNTRDSIWWVRRPVRHSRC